MDIGLEVASYVCATVGLILTVGSFLWRLRHFGKCPYLWKLVLSLSDISHLLLGIGIFITLLSSELSSSFDCKLGGFFTLGGCLDCLWTCLLSDVVFLAIRSPLRQETSEDNHKRYHKRLLLIFLIPQKFIEILLTILPLSHLTYFEHTTPYPIKCFPLRGFYYKGSAYFLMIVILFWTATIFASVIICTNLYRLRKAQITRIHAQSENVDIAWRHRYATLVLKSSVADHVVWFVTVLVTTLVLFTEVGITANLTRFLFSVCTLTHGGTSLAGNVFGDQRLFRGKEHKNSALVSSRLLSKLEYLKSQGGVFHMKCTWTDTKTGHMEDGFLKVYQPDKLKKWSKEIVVLGLLRRLDCPQLLRCLWTENTNFYNEQMTLITGTDVLSSSRLICVNYLSLGSMHELMYGLKSPLSTFCLTSLVQDIVEGLSHLHGLSVRHNNLTFKNIYVRGTIETQNLAAAIGNFENTEIVESETPLRRYDYSNEPHSNERKLETYQTDIRALALVLLEMITVNCMLVYSNSRKQQQIPNVTDVSTLASDQNTEVVQNLTNKEMSSNSMDSDTKSIVTGSRTSKPDIREGTWKPAAYFEKTKESYANSNLGPALGRAASLCNVDTELNFVQERKEQTSSELSSTDNVGKLTPLSELSDEINEEIPEVIDKPTCYPITKYSNKSHLEFPEDMMEMIYDCASVRGKEEFSQTVDSLPIILRPEKPVLERNHQIPRRVTKGHEHTGNIVAGFSPNSEGHTNNLENLSSLSSNDGVKPGTPEALNGCHSESTPSHDIVYQENVLTNTVSSGNDVTIGDQESLNSTSERKAENNDHNTHSRLSTALGDCSEKCPNGDVVWKNIPSDVSTKESVLSLHKQTRDKVRRRIKKAMATRTSSGMLTKNTVLMKQRGTARRQQTLRALDLISSQAAVERSSEENLSSLTEITSSTHAITEPNNYLSTSLDSFNPETSVNSRITAASVSHETQILQDSYPSLDFLLTIPECSEERLEPGEKKHAAVDILSPDGDLAVPESCISIEHASLSGSDLQADDRFKNGARKSTPKGSSETPPTLELQYPTMLIQNDIQTSGGIKQPTRENRKILNSPSDRSDFHQEFLFKSIPYKVAIIPEGRVSGSDVYSELSDNHAGKLLYPRIMTEKYSNDDMSSNSSVSGTGINNTWLASKIQLHVPDSKKVAHRHLKHLSIHNVGRKGLKTVKNTFKTSKNTTSVMTQEEIKLGTGEAKTVESKLGSKFSGNGSATQQLVLPSHEEVPRFVCKQNARSGKLLVDDDLVINRVYNSRPSVSKSGDCRPSVIANLVLKDGFGTDLVRSPGKSGDGQQSLASNMILKDGFSTTLVTSTNGSTGDFEGLNTFHIKRCRKLAQRLKLITFEDLIPVTACGTDRLQERLVLVGDFGSAERQLLKIFKECWTSRPALSVSGLNVLVRELNT